MTGQPARAPDGIGDTLRALRLSRCWRLADLAAASAIPHRWLNAARGQTRVVWIFSDGLSF